MHGMNTARARASKLAQGRRSSWVGTSRTSVRVALGVSARRHAPPEMRGVTRNALRTFVDVTRNRGSWPSLRRLERGAAVVGGCLCLVLSACAGTSSTPTPALRPTSAVTPSRTHGSVASSHGSVGFVYLAEPGARAPVVTPAALDRTVQVMRERLRAFGIGGARVAVSGANEITLSVPSVINAPRAVREVGRTGQLSFYDW